jgi:DNA replication and repair protein RecF
MESGIRNIALRHLYLYNFKNYKELDIHFNSGVVCFTGNNGSGKTNLLDAIHYLSFTKSFFNSLDSQNVYRDEDQCSITGEFERDTNPEHIVCAIRKGQRKIVKRNNKDYDRLSEHIGLIPSVIVTPYDIELIWEGSEERRKFIDSSISQYSRSYLDNLVAYNNALAQRNNLLKTFGQKGGYNPEFLEPWDYQLAAKGTMIFEERKQFIQELKPVFFSIYNTISSGKEAPEIKFDSDLFNADFESLLLRNREKDRMLERTTVGIHKDDLDFSLNGLSLKKFASQGQQKSFLIALKLAQFDFIRRHQQVNPILMLDDLFDKVDESRVLKILEWLRDNDSGQIFITDTHHNRVGELLARLHMPHEIWGVVDGTLEKLSV